MLLLCLFLAVFGVVFIALAAFGVPGPPPSPSRYHFGWMGLGLVIVAEILLRTLAH